MARRSTLQLAYQAIRIEGGLIPADELTRLTTLYAADKTEQTESHYSIPRGLKLRDEMGRFWKIAQSLWSDFQVLRQRQDVDAHQVTVRNLLVPLLRDVLGFADLAAGASVDASGHTFNIGYASQRGQVPVILAAHNAPLDVPSEHFGEQNPDTGKIRRRSPFMLAQEALNASDDALWAIATNGLKLRILRDNPSLTRPAYVEVDLEAIFTEELYADFTAFWLLTHASRFGRVGRESTEPADPANCPWERWRKAGQDAGVTVRMNLRYQVANALRALGTGFLRHPANIHLREKLQNQEQSSAAKQAFFDELLRLVYRFIFLATVEDRTDPTTGNSLIFTPDASEAARQRYRAGYSLTWLRERAARASSFDTHSDLWQALSITFDGLATGQPELGLPALGGLFAPDQFQTLAHAHIENRYLLAAVFQLGYFRQPAGLTRVNYRDMGAEELGSVYESLLELVPNLQNLSQPLTAKLVFVGDEDEASSDTSTKGNARKLTGSYYTPDSLVQELIKSALEPVIAQTVQTNPANPVEALLQLTVCDPACGSGHFLLAAARRLADEVAKLRAAQQGGAPSPADYRHALRDVVGHCIYGVDKNPMAIQLAKTALWLEAYTPDRPLTFIDHHLQVGDALLGVLDPKILENGIPDEAYAVLSGDDKAVASALKKQNKADLKSWKAISANDLFAASALTTEANAVEHLADDTLAGIAAKRSAWADAARNARHSTLARLADTYVAAFLTPKVAALESAIPLSGYLWALLRGQGGVNADIDGAADHLCRTHSVFHWWLAFPQVAAKGGFAVMLANPPWERIKLQEEEFFATRSPLVAMSKNKSERGKRIELLRQGLLLHTLFPDVEAAEGLSPPNRAEMQLYQEFLMARRGAEAASLYAHDSGRYPTTGVGDVNTYALFAETLSQLVSPTGRSGFIVPTGIATDDSTKAYFGQVSQTGRLVSLYDFENSEAVFPSVHRSYKFSLMTLGTAQAAEFVCFATQVPQLLDARRRFTLTPDEFRLVNPNTRTCPVFRSQRDAELTKKLYRNAPVLMADAPPEDGSDANPWGIRFSTMFHMSNDSGLFLDEPADALASGATEASMRLPLYEAKMIHQFDHRWATYVDAPDKPDGLDTKDVVYALKADAAFTVRPRYWVEEAEVLARIARVPSRVANVWLAWRKATTHAEEATGAETQKSLADSHSALTLALASWVAGALFLRAAEQAARIEASTPKSAPRMQIQTASLFGDPVPQVSGTDKPAHPWSNQVAANSTNAAERLMATRYPELADALKGAGTTGKKALPAFTKWALQDDPAQGLGLSDDELDALQTLQAPAELSHSAANLGATSEYSTEARGQFGLSFSWLDVWMDRRSPRWLMGWRDICRSTDERTVIASVFGRAGVGNNLPLMLFGLGQSPAECAALVGNLDSMVLDFVARHKVGGVHLNFFIIKQLPVLPPSRYTESDLAYIVPRVLELTHTAYDMQPWADDLAAYDPRPADQRQTPFPWNPERRAQLRAELDATYARLYGLTRDELRYILDSAEVMDPDYPSETFRVLQKNEMKAYGEYRTQRLVLEAWDVLVAGAANHGLASAATTSPIYSEQGVIRNEQEGDFAGLLAALIERCVDGIAVTGLQDIIAHAQLSNTYLTPNEATRLAQLVRTMDVLSKSAALTLIAPIVQRLESCGVVSRKRTGETSLYFRGASALPSDVLCRDDHDEIAQLMLLVEERRSAEQQNQGAEVIQNAKAQGNC